MDNGRLWFDHVRVPRENLLNRFADVSPDGVYSSPIPSPGKRFFTMVGTLVAGRISIAAASVSAAKTGLAIAVRYAERRRQFGPAGQAEIPILDYSTVKHRLFTRLATVYALDFAIKDLVTEYAAGERTGAGAGGGDDGAAAGDSGPLRTGGDRSTDRADGARQDGPDEAADGGHRRIEALAAGFKAVASRNTVDTLRHAREICGGQGYLAENRFGPLMADTDVFTTFEGANPVLLQLVARGLLTEFRDAMGELKLWDVIRLVAGRTATTVTELNPVVTRRTDEEHLRDAAFHRAALEFREERMLSGVARRLKGLVDQGMDSFDALNAAQADAIALALAHVERVMHERFAAGVADAPEELRPALDRLRALYGLSRIEADRAWFLEHGYLEAAKSRAVQDAVRALCTEIRPDAVALVDAFGIPDGVLRAPIAIAQD